MTIIELIEAEVAGVEARIKLAKMGFRRPSRQILPAGVVPDHLRIDVWDLLHDNARYAKLLRRWVDTGADERLADETLRALCEGERGE